MSNKFPNQKISVKNAVAAVLILSALTVGAKTLAPKPSYQSIGQRGIDCLISQNASCLVELADPYELKKLGATDTSLKRYLLEFVLPTYKLSQPLSEVSVGVDHGSGKVSVRQNLRLASGREVPLDFRVANTAKGPRIVGLVSSLFFITAEASRPVGEHDKPGRFVAFAETARKHGEKLTDLGIRGIWQESKSVVMTWEEIYTDQMLRAQKVSGAPASAQEQ